MKKFIYVLFALAAISSFYLTSAGIASAAVEVFVRIEGIKGESTDRAHAGWIDATSISHKVSQMGSTSMLDRTSSRAVFDDFMIVKKLDGSSPVLMRICASGQRIPEVIIELVRSTSVGKVIFARYVLNDVTVSSVSTNFSRPAEVVPEQVQFKYAKILQEHILIGRDGRPTGTTKQGWDLQRNIGL